MRSEHAREHERAQERRRTEVLGPGAQWAQHLHEIARGLQGDMNTSRVVVWRSGWASPRLLTGYSQPGVLRLGGGWLGWDSTLGWMDGPAEGSYRAPVSALP